MKHLLFTVLFLTVLFSGASFASVNKFQYMNAIAGEYKLVFEGEAVVCADVVRFSIDKNGAVKMIEDECGMMNALSATNFAPSEIGPIALPTTQVLLTYGSDEEQNGWTLSLTVKKQSDESSEVISTGLFYSVNDGPNGYTSVDRVTTYKIFKLNKSSGEFKEIRKI